MNAAPTAAAKGNDVNLDIEIILVILLFNIINQCEIRASIIRANGTIAYDRYDRRN